MRSVDFAKMNEEYKKSGGFAAYINRRIEANGTDLLIELNKDINLKFYDFLFGNKNKEDVSDADY